MALLLFLNPFLAGTSTRRRSFCYSRRSGNVPMPQFASVCLEAHSIGLAQMLDTLAN